MKTQPLKGMRDLLPREQALRDYIQGQILDTYRAAGFQRISTPILEDMENLDKSDGGDNLNLIFKVLKRGEKLAAALRSGDEKQLSDMGLRYDLTLPLSRYYAANRNELPNPFKVIQTDRVYRAERPQKGRLREFVQCDIDILGDSSPNAEVELIDVTARALLGIGSGLIIPLSTGLISKYFVGTYRVKQFGLSSAITNFTLVIATAVTGYLAEVSWHLPFLVYLLPLISILLVGHLKESRSDAAVEPSSQSTAPSGQTAAADTGGSKYGIHIRHLLQIMLFYGVTTFIVLAVIFNLSFLMEKHHFSSGNSGLMISLFFLAIMAPGFCLDKIVDELKERTKAYSLLSMAVGLALIWIAPIEWLIIPGCILVGLGYGIIQPMLYDKTTHTALPQKATMALAFVMMMNYLAILLYPFIIDFLQNLFHTQSQEFPFVFNLLITIVTFFWAYLRRDTFLFNDQLK